MEIATQQWQQPRESGFFHFLIEKQTYLNLVYLLLAFPLGIAYFVFLVTGFSLGFGLIVTFLGIPILLGMLAATWGIAAFERQLANTCSPPTSRRCRSCRGRGSGCGRASRRSSAAAGHGRRWHISSSISRSASSPSS